METLLDEKKYSVETLNVPKQVETAVAAIWKGNRLATPIGGGVHIEPHQALMTSNMLTDKDGKLAAERKQIDVKQLPANQLVGTNFSELTDLQTRPSVKFTGGCFFIACHDRYRVKTRWWKPWPGPSCFCCCPSFRLSSGASNSNHGLNNSFNKLLAGNSPGFRSSHY